MGKRAPSTNTKASEAAKKAWATRRQRAADARGAATGTAGAPAASSTTAAVQISAPPAPPAGGKKPSQRDVDEALVKIIVIASVLYLFHLTRNLPPEHKHAVRDNDDYVLTDDEAAALGPSVKRLLALVPGGGGASAAVAIGEQLSIVFVLMAYAERTAPIRADARDAAPARRMFPNPRRRQATPNGPIRSHEPAPVSPDYGGPAIAPGVAGSQHYT